MFCGLISQWTTPTESSFWTLLIICFKMDLASNSEIQPPRDFKKSYKVPSGQTSVITNRWSFVRKVFFVWRMLGWSIVIIFSWIFISLSTQPPLFFKAILFIATCSHFSPSHPLQTKDEPSSAYDFRWPIFKLINYPKLIDILALNSIIFQCDCPSDH